MSRIPVSKIPTKSSTSSNSSQSGIPLTSRSMSGLSSTTSGLSTARTGTSSTLSQSRPLNSTTSRLGTSSLSTSRSFELSAVTSTNSGANKGTLPVKKTVTSTNSSTSSLSSLKSLSISTTNKLPPPPSETSKSKPSFTQQTQAIPPKQPTTTNHNIQANNDQNTLLMNAKMQEIIQRNETLTEEELQQGTTDILSTYCRQQDYLDLNDENDPMIVGWEQESRWMISGVETMKVMDYLTNYDLLEEMSNTLDKKYGG